MIKRNEAKILVPIISAYAEGRILQYKEKEGWRDIEDSEGLSINTIIGEAENYRIKPEVKYRPFKNAEECWKEMQKHQPFGWTYDYTNNIWDSIARVTSSGIIYEEDIMCFEDVFNRVKFADGSPFGVKIEEE